MPKPKKDEREAKIIAFLALIYTCFESIKGDYTNPKQLCRTGMDAVVDLGELLKEKT